MVDRIRRAGQVSWAVMGVAAVVALLGWIAWVFRVVFPPLILAGAIVFILNPVVTWLQRRHVPRAAGAALSYLGVLATFVLIGLLVAPLASRQADELSEEWPDLKTDIEDKINDLSERSKTDKWFVEVPNTDEIADAFSSDDKSLTERLSQIREYGIQAFHVLLIIFLAPIIAFYLLVDLPHIRRVAESLIPERSRPEVMLVARRLNRAIGGFFRGQLVVAMIVGTMVSIGLAIIGLPFWLIVGMIAGGFNMIPLIGPWVGAVPGVVIALTTREFSTALWVVLIMAIAQQIDNHFITPNVMQRAVKLHPAVVMLALLAGGTLGGFFGLLLAVPATATLKILVGHLWRTYVLGQPLGQEAQEWMAADSAPGTGSVEAVGVEPPAAGDSEAADDDAGEDAAAEKALPATGVVATKELS